MRKYILTISVLFSMVLCTFGQDSAWSLEDCISYAMENNIMIKQTQLNSSYNENILSQSKINRLPNLNASSSYDISFGRSLDYTTYEYIDERTNNVFAGLTSNATLFNGFQQKNTIEKNEFNLMASIQNTEKIKNDISLNIAAAFLQILFSQELENVARNQLDITAQQVERTQKMVDAGKVAMGNALEIQAQYAAEELNLVNAENQLIMAYLNLQLMLDLQYDPEFQIVNPDLASPETSMILGNVEEVFASAEQIMPQVKSSEYSLKAAEEDLAIAKGGLYPNLGISANSYTRYSDQAIDYRPDADGSYTFAEQFDDNLSLGLGLDLRIPIFNRNQVKTQIANARINIENSELELQSTKNDLYRSIQQAYVDATGALKKYNSSEKALISMEESFKYTEKKFEVGLVNTVDYNTSKNQLTMTQSELLQSKYDFIFKTKILNFYKGENITL
ncbi:TolC family protein [Bacteroidota bacterium]